MPAPEKNPRAGASTRHHAVAQRQRVLGRIRSLSVAIFAGATAVTAGLAAAFAQAVPGHASTVRPTLSQSPASPSPLSMASSPGTSPSHTGAGSATSQPSSAPSSQLAPPPQPPASTPAAPVTSSGAS